MLAGGADITVPVQRRDATPNGLAAADERHRALFELMPAGVIYCSADGSVLGANPAARQILGLPDAGITSWPLPAAGRSVHQDGTPFRPEELPVRRALSTGQPVSDVLMGVPHGQTGERRWVLATAIPDARDGQGRPQRVYLLLTDVTEQRKVEAALREGTRAEREHAELLTRERAALAEARSASERLAFLMEAGALVAATGNRDELLDQVTQLVVPSLADYCLVFLPTADGQLRVGALTHADPALSGKLAVLREHPVPAVGPMMSQRAYSTRTTQLARDVPAELPSWATVDPDATEVVASVHPESAVATPLLVGQRLLGVMVMARAAARPRFASADAEVVEEIARRLAVGLANADTFAREHAIAETLQRSILPDTLPQIPGVDLAVRYLPGTQGANVGGDWYDAFPLAGGRIALVTGDVAGHSIGSASVMGQVRSMLRAYAIDDPHPGRVLRRTNAALARLLPDALASAVYAVLDLSTGDLSYANAGHPPPIVVTGAGQAEYLDDTTGTMLGACADIRFTTGLRRLSPGTGLLCYTDGLIEDRHRDLTKGLALLASTLRLSAPSSAEHMCATVEAALLGAAHRADDVCLLAAQLTA